jgi:ABC-type transport system involved in multi-copper enzyme maturation permease subunit
MTALRNFFSFPLLAKELTEAAARRRTYVVRIVYALLLFVAFGFLVPEWFWSSNHDPASIMGEGEEMLQAIIGLQFIGIGLFLPAMMCGRITQEKERDSLVLLFLTDLRPWSIVLQKYLGGLVPMLSFLLLAMPLTATAYAFGGFTIETLLLYLYALLLGCLQVGALAILCSAFFRTTVSALIATYVLGAGLYLLPLLIGGLIHEFLYRGLTETDCLLFFPPVLIEYDDAFSVFLRSIPTVVSIVVLLLLARFSLVRRAFLPPAAAFLRLFRWLDRGLQWTNRFLGGVTMLRSNADLPGNDPIAWREMSRRALGRANYLVRILLMIEIPVIFICIVIAANHSFRYQDPGISLFAALVGGLAILALSIQAANTIVSERVHQTLEVLLTTPLSAREIVAQKARVLRRFMIVLTVPLLTIFTTEALIEHILAEMEWSRDTLGWYVTSTLLTLTIYLPLICWFCLWLGLKVRSRYKAILLALGATVAWCAVPILVAALIFESGLGGLLRHSRETIGVLVLLFSPLAVPAITEVGELSTCPLFDGLGLSGSMVTFLTLTVNFLFYGALLFFFRYLALSRADRYLRR